MHSHASQSKATQQQKPAAAMPADPADTVYVDQPVAACDGNGDEPGHPRVFLDLGKTGAAECPYCSRRFVLKSGARADGH